MSPPPSTDRLRQIRDRTDETCPFLFTLLGLVAVAEDVLRAAVRRDAGEHEELTPSDAADEGGLMVALGAVALAHQLTASCADAERREKLAAAPRPEPAADGIRSEDPWCEALV